MPYLEFLRQEYWDGLPFPSLVDHVLSEVFTMTHQSWVALHSMAHSFTELHKPLHQTPPWRGFMQSFMCNLCTCMCCWAVVNVYSPVFSTTTKEQNLPIIAESPMCHSFTSQTWPQPRATADMFLHQRLDWESIFLKYSDWNHGHGPADPFFCFRFFPSFYFCFSLLLFCLFVCLCFCK